jgi:hypothetical protein
MTTPGCWPGPDDLGERLFQAVPGPHLGQRARTPDLAVIEHRDVVAELLDQGHDVTAHQHRAARRGEAVENGPHDRGRDRIDRLERLVQHQQPRPVQQRGGQADLLAHAGGVVADQGGFGRLQVQHVQQFLGPGRHHGRGH